MSATTLSEYILDFADHSEVELERLQAERTMEKKRSATGLGTGD